MAGVIVTLEFQGPPPCEAVLDLIDSRIKGKDDWKPPTGMGEKSQYVFCDYDFPGFKGEPSIMEKRWRSPIIDFPKFQALLHVIGYPNYMAYIDDLPGPCTHRPDSFDASDPTKLTAEEVQMAWAMFPELKIVKDKFLPDPPSQTLETGLDLV